MSESLRILVVDDEAPARTRMRDLLADLAGELPNHIIGEAADGVEALDLLADNAADVALVDIRMPRMDGIELVTLIKRDRLLNTLPVMIVSYKDREEDRRRGLDAGADYYLAKSSFHDEALLDAVRDLIGEAHT